MEMITSTSPKLIDLNLLLHPCAHPVGTCWVLSVPTASIPLSPSLPTTLRPQLGCWPLVYWSGPDGTRMGKANHMQTHRVH
jgi:hypothetical protein